MPLDYYAQGGGEGDGDSLNMRGFLCVFFSSSLSFPLKTSPEGYIIYRIVNCVSVI